MIETLKWLSEYFICVQKANNFRLRNMRLEIFLLAAKIDFVYLASCGVEILAYSALNFSIFFTGSIYFLLFLYHFY